MSRYRSVSISAGQKQLLLSHAAGNRPDESCAILLGRDAKGDISISEILLAENADRSPTSFAIPDGDLLKMYGIAEAAGLDIVAVFHSHPLSEAYPSAKDRRFMECNPVTWMIAGSSGEIRAFVLDAGIREIPIAIRDDPKTQDWNKSLRRSP